MENQGEGFAGNDQLSEELEQVFQEEPLRKDDDDDDDDESTPDEDETWDHFRDDPMRVIYGIDKDADSSSSSNSQTIIPKEKFISKLASKFAFDKNKSVDQNIRVFASLAENPYCMLTTKYPSYPDYMHHQHTGSMTAWTDSYYDAANEFEKDIQAFVFHGLSTLLKVPILQKWQKKLNIFTSVIANFIRVAPKVINLQKLIREACPKSTHVIKLCMNHRGSQAQHRDAELEREAVFEFLKANDPIDEEQWDKEIYPDGA